MRKGRKILNLVLAGVLCFTIVMPVQASSISDVKKEGAELESQKKDAEEAKSSLSSELSSIISDVEETQTQIASKEEELELAEEELFAAQIEESNQYDSMKLRIRYMYENGNTEFLHILLESESIGDFLNKAEYISQISEYDRNMLDEFRNAVKLVQDKEAQLQTEYAELEVLQNTLIEKQSQVETLLAEKSDEIAGLDAAISENTQKLNEMVAEAQRRQKEAEAAKGSGGSGTPGSSVVSGNGQFAHPIPGYSRISSYFGNRDQPLAGASTNHKGMDFAAPVGTPVYAADDGVVVSASYMGNAGRCIIIKHDGGLVTKYMHNDALYVSAGQRVSRGQNIAASGNTGNSTGPHLHFQVELNGKPVNPQNYL